MQDAHEITGSYEICINGKVVVVIKNAITIAGLNAWAKAAAGVDSARIKYLAIGSDSTAVAVGQTSLVNETARFAVTSASASGAVCTTVFNIFSGEGNGQIEEIGIIVGDAASDDANSGTLLSRVLWSHCKTAGEEITITRSDTFGRA